MKRNSVAGALRALPSIKEIDMSYIVNNATFETLADARAEAQRIANASGKVVRFATGWNTRTVVMPQTVPAAPAVAPAAQVDAVAQLVDAISKLNHVVDGLNARLEALETKRRARRS